MIISRLSYLGCDMLFYSAFTKCKITLQHLLALRITVVNIDGNLVSLRASNRTKEYKKKKSIAACLLVVLAKVTSEVRIKPTDFVFDTVIQDDGRAS